MPATSDDRQHPPFSVIVPAHNEAAVIERFLSALLSDAPPDRLPEIVVVCNGCTDDTSTRARRHAPAARVIDIATGSKPLALNAGNNAATAVPRFFVDADIVVTYRDLAAVAECLDGGIMAAAPRLVVDLSQVSWIVRSYYRVWCDLPYVTNRLIGSGIYGLSAEALARVGSFPDIISDDAYVRSLFSESERASIGEHRARQISFTVFPPRSLQALIAVETRRRAGLNQLRELGLTASTDTGRTFAAMGGSGRSFSLLDVGVFTVVKLAARSLARLNAWRGRQRAWLRDDSSRQT